MPELSRRTLLVGAAITGTASRFPAPSQATAAEVPVTDAEVSLRWLEGQAPRALVGTTWGVPWPRGALTRSHELSLTTATGQAVPVQSWPIGFWPDGTVKWTAHAIGAEVAPAETYMLRSGKAAAPAVPLRVTENADAIDVDTGVIRCRIARRGRVLVPSISRGDRTVATNGTLVCLRKDTADDAPAVVRTERHTADIRTVTVEQRGPVRAVVRVEGMHRAERAPPGVAAFHHPVVSVRG